jgi:hypothetical protein
VDAVEIQAQVSILIDSWCDRRCLNALREILAGWPIGSGLTDDWARLGESLKSVRALAREELEEGEIETVERLIADVDRLVFRGHS